MKLKLVSPDHTTPLPLTKCFSDFSAQASSSTKGGEDTAQEESWGKPGAARGKSLVLSWIYIVSHSTYAA